MTVRLDQVHVAFEGLAAHQSSRRGAIGVPPNESRCSVISYEQVQIRLSSKC